MRLEFSQSSDSFAPEGAGSGSAMMNGLDARNRGSAAAGPQAGSDRDQRRQRAASRGCYKFRQFHGCTRIFCPAAPARAQLYTLIMRCTLGASRLEGRPPRALWSCDKLDGNLAGQRSCHRPSILIRNVGEILFFTKNYQISK
jgi:hypothetical protein